MPDFDMANFSLGGADSGGKSKLHGVVNISDGAVTASMGGNATSTVNSAPAVLQVILNNVISICFNFTAY
jgi:hypothetical protein